MSIRESYNQCRKQHGHENDPSQESIVARLDELQQRLIAAQSLQRGLRRLFSSGQTQTVRGLYVWGGVGRGKTFLMDLFFETLDIGAKKRIHFHRMMHEVHARLKALDAIENPLEQVAADIAKETRILCFDEFFVSDIGDAMILGALLDGLFRHGVTLITTSNSRPDDLYKNGLQRQRFLPAIELLNKNTQVVHLDGILPDQLVLTGLRVGERFEYTVPPGLETPVHLQLELPFQKGPRCGPNAIYVVLQMVGLECSYSDVLEAVPLSDFEVEWIVRGRHFDGAGPKFRVDSFVSDDGDLAACER